MRIFCCCRRNE